MPKIKAHAPDYKTIISFSIILVFGLVMLASASQVVGLDTFNDPYYHLKHQLFFGILPGAAFLIIFANINYRFLKKIALPFFIISILLLIFVFIPGLGFSHAGARRWVDLKLFSFQPAELAKLSCLIFFSAWFAQKKEQMKNFHSTLVPFVSYLGIITLLIALQPDIGTLSVIIAISLAVFLVAGARISHLGLIVLIGILSFIILIQAAPYRVSRITSFLNPTQDIQGKSYQINQSLLAIGSGGMVGLGLGQSKQKYQYLPEVVGDSIFAVIAEELGFIFTSIFLILFLYFIFSGFRIALKSKDPFAQNLTSGIMTWFAYQALVNVGSMVNMLPLTGLPFPFLSYGSSSLVVSMIAIGILINVSRYTQKLRHKKT